MASLALVQEYPSLLKGNSQVAHKSPYIFCCRVTSPSPADSALAGLCICLGLVFFFLLLILKSACKGIKQWYIHMHACTVPHMYADLTHLCHRLNPVKERPRVHRNDPDTFLPCNASVRLQGCSGLLPERASREVLPPRMPVFLCAWDWLASPLQSHPPRNQAELLLAWASKVSWFLYPGFTEIFQACMI